MQGDTRIEGVRVQEKIPGPDGPANDNWNKRPDAEVATRRRITEDPRKLHTHE
jgi:hypothetical protein